MPIVYLHCPENIVYLGLSTADNNSCSNQADVCKCLVVQTPMDNMSKSKLHVRTSLTHVACDSKLLSVVRSSMPRKVGGNQGYSCVLCCAQAAHAFNAGIKCWHGTFRAISSFSKVKRSYSNERI